MIQSIFDIPTATWFDYQEAVTESMMQEEVIFTENLHVLQSLQTLVQARREHFLGKAFDKGTLL